MLRPSGTALLQRTRVFEVAPVGAKPLHLAGARPGCCANVVLLGRACPKPCVSIGVIVVLYVFHDAASHNDDGKHCSQSEVTQNCVKNRSCKPCCQSENCCPAISHYDTPLCYNLVSMLTGLSIPYSLAKDHGYMPELSLFPAYVRTGCVRTYAAIDPKHAYRRDKRKRQGTTAMVIPCLCSFPFTALHTLAAEPPVNKKRTRTLSYRESGSSTNCMVGQAGLEPAITPL